MNKKQISILWLGIILFVLFALCPPWIKVVGYPSRAVWEVPIDSYLIWDPPQWEKDESMFTGAKVDAARLALEWLVVIVLTAALIWNFESKPKITNSVVPISTGASEKEKRREKDSEEALPQEELALMESTMKATEEITKCPACQAENPGRLKYCPDCGVLQKSK